MALKQVTFAMDTNSGYVIDLGGAYSSVNITSTVLCAVKVSPTELTAPVATQIPSAAGTSTDFYRIAANGSQTFSYEFPKGGNQDNGDVIRYIAVRSEGSAGLLIINAH